MATKSCFLAVLLAAALAACAELTAEAPLFTPADQIGPPPLTEGIWITLQEDCPDSFAHRRIGRFPADCTPFELTRLEDGAWQARLRVDLVYGISAQERAESEETAGPYRLIIAPAVERADADAYAPIYVAETTRADASGVGYMVIAPIGAKPATTALIVLSVGCADILRDGPIEGVSEQHRVRIDESGVEHRELSGCIASTQGAVREAARRALIENLDEMLERRFVHVRAQ
jgi:hypothetical protein